MFLEFAGANPDPQPVGSVGLPGKVHYLVGSDPAHWRTDVPTWSGVAYRDLYEGISLLVEGNRRKVVLSYTLAAGAATEMIVLRVGNVNELAFEDDGALFVRGPSGKFRLAPPLLGQATTGEQTTRSGKYLPVGDDTIALGVGELDPELPITISLELTGLPRFAGQNWNADGFVIRLSRDGTIPVHSMLIGGEGQDEVRAVALSTDGSLWLTGVTEGGLPVSEDAIKTETDGSRDAFVAHLAADGIGDACDA